MRRILNNNENRSFDEHIKISNKKSVVIFVRNWKIVFDNESKYVMFVTTKYEEAKNISRSLLNRNLADDYCYLYVILWFQ